MKFKNQVGELEETSDDCLTPVETSKIKRDHEEIKTEKKNHQKLFKGEFRLCFNQRSRVSQTKRDEGPPDRRLAWF